MPNLQLHSIACRVASRSLFESLDWSLEPGQRIGLVGPNGAGKSTLLQVLAGLREPEVGRVSRRRGLALGHLPQDISLPEHMSVLEAALVLPERLASVDAEIAACESALADPAVQSDARRLERAIGRHERALARFEDEGGGAHTGRVRGLLAHLGFREEVLSRPAASASGGETKLVAIARLLAAEPDVLLLDEPDNHLDLAAKARLESLLRGFAGTLVIVSHDRYLLDDVVTQIAELDGRLSHYVGNYSSYVTTRELAALHQRKAYADQQKEIARIEASIKRFEEWARRVVNERHIRQARSRRRALDRMEERGEMIDRPSEARRMQLALPGQRGSRQALEAIDLAVGIADELLLVGVELMVRHGERVGMVGPNGCGKTVLMRTFTGELEPLQGQLKRGPSTRVGYYAQRHETLDAWGDHSPLELIRNQAPMDEGAAVALLGRFLFDFQQAHQPIRTLSGGERSRLQLAHVVLARPNLLLLDEPTNNLDIPSAEVLEAELDSFEGAVVVVSHDRYFLDRIVDRVVAFEDGELVPYTGGYTDYLASRDSSYAGTQ